MVRLLVLCLGFLLLADQAHSRHPQSEQPFNVLFLAVDDMRDWVGYLNGYRGQVFTPNIDRLAAQGVSFTNAHCPSPKCAPSRASILLGQMPSTTGLYDNGHWWRPNFPRAVSLPMLFGANGYRVVGAGKVFHHTAGNNPPDQWDDFQRLVFRNDPWFRGNQRNYPYSKPAANPPGFPFAKLSGLPHENDWGSLPIAEQEYDDVLTAKYAVEYLEQRRQKQDQPFFLACGIFRPHLPWYVPQRFFDLYPIDGIKAPEVLESDLDDVPAEGLKLAGSRRSDLEKIQKNDKTQHAIQAYLASISFADEQIGNVLKALEDSGEAHRTIVVFWSDHGWHLGEKNHWHKSTLWEEATRIPFILKRPGWSNHGCSEAVSLVDIFPTLIELCRLEARELQPLDGESLVPLLRQAGVEREKPAVIEFRKGNAAVRDERFRLIRYADGLEELYDHSRDPHEWHNLASEPALRSEKDRLGQWLPKEWAPEALTKGAFEFDPVSYTWRAKESPEAKRR